MDRWPAAMRIETLAEYLDVSVSMARRIVNDGKLPAIQHGERGDRYYLRIDADAYLDRRRNMRVTSAREA